MPIKLILTPQLAKRLKQPLGTLIQGSFIETMKRLGSMAKAEKPASIISVGDTVSKNLVKSGFSPKVMIIDNKCMRKSTRPAELPADQTVYVANPRGMITEEADAAIEKALKDNQRVKIIVDGEEDLLTLIAITHAPDDFYVVYGQPHEGIVVVKTSPEKKAEIAKILKSMEKPQKAK